ncbi:MAG: hypothetical protein EOP62_13885 [Sphingomonadales bacterium]|nr:MAG: hypothetical protein EOP62_13885 [Sphingomonadales bacterium]
MTLSAFDDYLIHQIVEPVRHVETSDRNFYDRHYFNLYAPDGSFFLIVGMGQYPNLGTQDAFALYGNRSGQIALRSSRLLGDRSDMQVGPISIEVLEGLKRLRIVVGPNETGLECDVIFEGTHAPSLEPRSVNRVNGRVLHDIMRYNQVGSYQGDVRFKGDAAPASGKAMRGYRDRSWGIRPVGEIEPDGVRKVSVGGSASAASNFQFVKIAADFIDFGIHLNVIEHDGSRRSVDQAEIVRPGNHGVEHLGQARFDFEFTSDRRFIERAVIVFGDGTSRGRTLSITPLVPVYIEAGSGYGRAARDEWTHGVFRGDDVTDSLSFDFSVPDKRLYGGIDAFSRFEFEGSVGHGLFEYSLFGKLDRLGFPGPGYFNQIAG